MSSPISQCQTDLSSPHSGPQEPSSGASLGHRALQPRQSHLHSKPCHHGTTPAHSHSKPVLPFQPGCCLELMPKTLNSSSCVWPGVDEKQGNRPSKAEPEKQRSGDWISSSPHQLKSKCNYFVSITASRVHFCLRETERNENMPFPLWHC